MNAPESRLTIPAIGSALAGGICLGHIFINGQPFALIVPPKAEREHAGIAWHHKNERIPGACSLVDGYVNTRDMLAAGSPLAKWATEQRIAGFDDWYIPSRIEALTIRANLSASGTIYKPTDDEGFDADDWYWTSTQNEFSDAHAWMQLFGNGYQFHARKSDEYRAFVVRRLPIQ